METLDLNKFKKQETDVFSLWGIEYKYSFCEADKTYFKNSLEVIDLEKDLIWTWIKIFKKLLQRENDIVVVLKEDIIWLLSYFTYKYS